MNSSKSGMKERTSINSRVRSTGLSHCASRISLPCSVSQANARRLSPATLSSLGRRPSSQRELVEERGELAVDAVLVRRIESFQVDTGGEGAVCSMATRVGHAEKFVLQSSVFTQSSEAVNFRT